MKSNFLSVNYRTLLLSASLFFGGVLLTLPGGAASWSAQPLVVHEWGVQVFDWSKPTPTSPPLPDFIHTDAHPGTPVVSTQKRVKDLPPDSGIRFKPVLYFYPPANQLGENLVGVEMRFAYGHANAWYPQASVYRTPGMTANAKEPDWDAWRKANGPRMFADPKKLAVPVPDDERMELVWSRLTLSKDVPAGVKLPEVDKGHWISIARQVQSAYVSNGTEAEKFLFYEGATHERPAVTLIADADGFMSRPSKMTHIVNVTDLPLYNVFAIYHHDHHTWIGYATVLEPIKPASQQGGAGSTITSLAVPDFAAFNDWTDDKTIVALTIDRLRATLTEGGGLSINHDLRDPADPQGPTQCAELFPDEAQALETIWHDDFFNNDGLTILYRESPAALDRAMPLNLYTDMYHYIKFSRCGLVVNKNIDPAQVMATYFGVAALPYDSKMPAATLAALKANRFLTEGNIAYFERLGRDPKQIAEMRAALDKN
jgi:hypothetical protein